MTAQPRAERCAPKRPALWDFETLDHMRSRLLQRAGRFTSPKGTLTLTMSANQNAQHDIRHYLEQFQQTA